MSLRPGEPDQLDELMEALANPHRRDIVYLLGLQPFAVHQLAEARGLSLPAIHKHIKILEQVGLVTRRKRGRTNYLTLDPRPLALLQTWVNQFHPHWGGGAEASYRNYAHHLGFDSADLDGTAGPATPSPLTGDPE